MSHSETSPRPRPVYWKDQKQSGAKDFPGVTLTTQDGTRTLEKERIGTLNDNYGNHNDTKNHKEKGKGGQPRPAHRLKGKWTMNGAPHPRPWGCLCLCMRCSLQDCLEGSSRIRTGLPAFSHSWTPRFFTTGTIWVICAFLQLCSTQDRAVGWLWLLDGW